MYSYYVKERETKPTNMQKLLASQQVDDILGKIVIEYTKPTNVSRNYAQDVGRRYAIAQRDYWDNQSEIPDYRAMRQIWTDALVKAATENDWDTMKLAIEFDISTLSEIATPLNQLRSIALTNLINFF